MPIKRLKYFTHQFLTEQDFDAEQAYHIAMRRLLNRAMHGWGVVEGLTVRIKNNKQITVDPGVAIDGQGREIVLTEPVTRDLSSFDPGTYTYIVITYDESLDDHDRDSRDGIEGHTRTTESPLVSERRHEPLRDGSVLILARVRIKEDGKLSAEVETRLRTDLHPRESAAGWLRLPFKPVHMEALRVGGKLVPPKDWDPGVDFTIDVASSYCENSARGTMSIPVPPGASRVKAFRLCGTTHGRVEVEFVRGGWNAEAKKSERTKLAERRVERLAEDGAFDEVIELGEDGQELGDLHSLSVGVIAEGKTEIWIVAARFE